MSALKINYSQEIIAGLTTFFTMSYIVIVNPQVMASPGTGLTISGTLTATVLISFLMSLLAGIYIRLPYALAPGMGLNVFIAYSLIIGEKIPWPTALGIIFWSSFIFILISVFPIRQKIVEALPNNMKHAMSCGIGLFLAFIGLKNLGLIVPNPATYIALGDINLPIALGLLGFLVIFILFNKNKSYAFLFSIFLITSIALLFGLTKLPETYFSTPDFQSHFFKLDLIGSLKWSFIPVILSVLLTNLFDSMSSLIGLANSAGFIDKKGNPLRLKETLMVDSIASLFSSLFGTSPATVFIESSTGIQAGGRTGLTAIVAAFCFLPCLFIAPIVTAIPVFATAPILIFVGILMCKTLKHVKANTLDDIIPIFLTIVLMPLTFSITQGVLWGIVSYVILKICVGKIKVISPVLWVLALICFLALVTEHSTFLEFIMK
ncbi:NCS2 family permease [Fluviispira sanaruensis]|uniref:NCS2 family permease n=1 Tax=Fluviispira sanaruensis TaxID=2493639 RepID=A0A4P2VNP2_FLUSA|nr:NCS2 family permease [Fluviispira sanaruensis]BBH53784.1 NCS2 family permease [Fluviispira sanaruensis]